MGMICLDYTHARCYINVLKRTSIADKPRQPYPKPA